MRMAALVVSLLAACGCAQERGVSRRPETVGEERRETPYRPDTRDWKWAPARKAQDPPKEPSKADTLNLRVEEVAVPMPKRGDHGLIVFARHQDDEDGRLPVPPAGKGTWFHLIWSQDPSPTLYVGQTDAVYDPKVRSLRVTIRIWNSRPGPGIGMDRGVVPALRSHAGFRVSLMNLPAGDHAYEVLEEARSQDGTAKTRVLSSGKFTLGR